MRTLGALCVVVAISASSAYADRSTVIMLGATFDGRAIADSYQVAADKQVEMLGGMRLTLAWEDAPLAVPPPTLFAHDTRIVPELYAGFLSDDHHAEGMLGAGLRGELQLASNRDGFHVRTALYTAVRVGVISGHDDATGELAFGEYILLGSGRSRLGWEGAAMMRPRYDGQRELDAEMTVYVGWSR